MMIWSLTGWGWINRLRHGCENRSCFSTVMFVSLRWPRQLILLPLDKRGKHLSDL